MILLLWFKIGTVLGSELLEYFEIYNCFLNMKKKCFPQNVYLICEIRIEEKFEVGLGKPQRPGPALLAFSLFTSLLLSALWMCWHIFPRL